MAEKSKPGRFKALQQDEKEVCRRMAQIRRTEGLNQAQFASRIGVTRDQIANIESGRVSLKWPVGIMICRAFNVSQLWLSTGQEPLRPFFDLDEAQDWTGVPDTRSFAAACKDSFLKELTFRRNLLLNSKNPETAVRLAKTFHDAVESYVNAFLAEVSEENKFLFLERLPRVLRKLLFQVEMGRRRSRRPPGASGEG